MGEIRSQPGRRLASSAGLGWLSVNAERHRDPRQLDEFTGGATSDLFLVLVTAGRYRIESRQRDTWRVADYAAGSVGVTAPGVASVFRWRSSDQTAPESLHLRFPVARVHQTLDDFGVHHDAVSRLDALSLEDAYASASLSALGQALDARATGLYADSVAQALLVHLTHLVATEPSRRTAVARDPGALSGRQLAQVIDYMRDRIGDDVDLDRLAGLVNISKFHFLRMFTKATGVTPHRYLVDLRLRRAAELLRSSGLSVQRIALACGYSSPSRFAASFRRRYGLPPTEYRR